MHLYKKANKISKNMKYVIGIGSNIGDKALNIKNVLELISRHICIVKTSNVYESKALLKPGMPKAWDQSFLNLAILIDFLDDALDLLHLLKSIEREMGRGQDSLVWAPRVIDLDILIAENLVVQEEKLHIPHIELLHRDFALLPASEVAPDFLHPLTQKTLEEHCAKLNFSLKQR